MHVSVHKSSEMPGNGESESSASVCASHAVVGLFERVEESSLRVERNADAGVADDERKKSVDASDLKRDESLRGELDGVAEKIEKDLTEPKGVGEKSSDAKVRREVDGEDDAFGLGGDACEVDDVIDAFAEGDFSSLDGHASGFNFR